MIVFQNNYTTEQLNIHTDTYTYTRVKIQVVLNIHFSQHPTKILFPFLKMGRVRKSFICVTSWLSSISNHRTQISRLPGE